MTSSAARGVTVKDLEHSYSEEPVLHGVSLDVSPGESIALLGPSGCGKTTLLRLIAGLEKPSSGSMTIGEEIVAGSSWVPPDRRRVGMVFQDWALFPHLSVAKNVAYGISKSPSKDAEVTAALEMMDLAGLQDRMPATLSGGQQQRVALARALAPRPGVLLLDEPFSNLDTSLRIEVRTEVHQLLADLGITSIFVTHDQDEAFIVGDRVAVMRKGRIVQTDSPQALYHHPIDQWTAEFVGTVSVLKGNAASGFANCSLGSVAIDPHLSGSVDLVVRPEQLSITAGGDAQVQAVEYYGHDSMIFVALGNDQVRVRCGPSTKFSRGDQVQVQFTSDRALAFKSD
ncbi:MAG TPA: ABC transporter ATP-binding protein [Acidimicrobiaceae bacterium]|nr:ABC transporter ATP-binding protein [Acidimicrobiaceae bacterium]HAX05631.1 ABC transporter ATP-binding protein [Acidimicrobiaceae bacterium]|tara:strand:+ start:363 stop:1388 length:1026 start_codon:yes stop_codon:yes gene_type:complete